MDLDAKALVAETSGKRIGKKLSSKLRTSL